MRFLADENFDGGILGGLRGRPELIDVVRVQDVGFTAASDPDILEWAAEHGRILLTQDIKTMPRYAYERVAQGLPMPGVICVPKRIGIGPAIADLIVLIVCSTEQDFDRQVKYIPL